MISSSILFVGVLLSLVQGTLLSNNMSKSVGHFLKLNDETKMRETSSVWNKAIGTGIYEVAYLNKQRFIRKFIIKMKESDGIKGIQLEMKDSQKVKEGDSKFGYSVGWEERWESDWKDEYLQCFDKIEKFYKPFVDFEFAADGGENSYLYAWWLTVVGANRNTGEIIAYKCFKYLGSRTNTGAVSAKVKVTELDAMGDSYVIGYLDAGINGKKEADNIYVLLLSYGRILARPNDLMFALDSDLPMTCYWLLKNKKFDMNELYEARDRYEGSFTIFQYSIYKGFHRLALKIMEEYDVEVLKEDSKRRTVFEYWKHRSTFISATKELDQKLQLESATIPK